MASDESRIRDALTKLILRLVNLVLRALGLLDGTQVPQMINITAIWKVEIWWELTLPVTVRETGLGPEAEVRLRTALGQLADRLGQVAVGGGGAEEIHREVIKFRDQWVGWAHRTAVTESTRLASEAVLASPEAQRPGAAKEWVTSHDERVRASHRLVDGERLPLEASFQVGGGALRYPGDPLGDPEQVVGCRCRLRIIAGRSK